MSIWFTWITSSPFYLHGFTSILAWISNYIPNYIHDKVSDKITYSVPNFISATVEVWEWISNFTPHLTWWVITYPCCHKSQSVFAKGNQGAHDITIMTQSTSETCVCFMAYTIPEHTETVPRLWDITAHRNKTQQNTLCAYFIENPAHMYFVKFYLEVLVVAIK